MAEFAAEETSDRKIKSMPLNTQVPAKKHSSTTGYET